MAKTTKPLTNTEVKQAKPKEKEYNLADGNGLYLRIKPIGSKIWLFNYSRPYTKKRANLSLGAYPEINDSYVVSPQRWMTQRISSPKAFRCRKSDELA